MFQHFGKSGALFLLALLCSRSASAQSSLSLASGSAVKGGSVSLNLSLTTSTSTPAGLQWTLSYASADIASLTAVAGSALTAASKTLSCAAGVSSVTCLAVGPNANAIGSGVVAVVTATLNAASSSSSDPISISNVVGVLPDGTATTVSGTGGSISVTQSNPVPTITTISPLSTTAGAAAFTLTVNGTGFNSSSLVKWNAIGHTTTLVSSTQLQAAIPASDVLTAGTATVTVFNPAPAGGTSNGLTFTIGSANPVPTISTISPSNATAGAAAFTLTVNGTGFNSSSLVKWNAIGHTTTLVSSTQLQATIPASDVLTAGTATVTVFNPAPGGGTSGGSTFAIGMSMWSNSVVPGYTWIKDPNALSLGVKFRSDVSGSVTGIRFYKGSSLNNGSHTGMLYSSTGTLLAQATFTAETASGWQQVSLSNPVTITANTTYVVAYFTTTGCAYDPTFFDAKEEDSAPLHALKSGVDGLNGVCAVGPNPQFPPNGCGANYWVDVVFAPSAAPASIPAPAITTISPANATTGTAAFTLTVNGTGFTSGSVVKWNGTSRPTTFVSATQLQVAIMAADVATAGTTKVTVFNPGGGTSGNSTFTTTMSIWTSSAMPAYPWIKDPNALSLGVKFRSDVSGTVTGIRFYKGSSLNNGTHTGMLYSGTGTLLAQATFTAETASGWQQVNLSNPVAITANSTYVVAYFTTTGCAYDPAYLDATGVDRAPLHALKSGVDGPNGVCAVGPNPQFPPNGCDANYWVDVVFAPGTIPPVPASMITTLSTDSSATAASPQTTFMSAVSLHGAASATEITAARPATAFHPAPGVGTSYSAPAFTAAATLLPASSIWSTSAVPAAPWVSDPNPITVGVKFRSDVSGKVNGIRFYKGAGNSGPHIGLLYSNTGTLLAQATFSAETPAGWQQVDFSNPVSITANTTYIAAYHSATGYADDRGHFTSTTADNAPLHALKPGVDGHNGLYTYGDTPQFPTQSSMADSNYWVDVDFSPASNNSIWTSSTVPATPWVNDSNPIAVGFKFRSDVSGHVTGIRFYKGPGNSGPHTGLLYSNTGTLLARAAFSDETPSGWQQVNFSRPVAIAANTTYIAAYYTTTGYADDQGHFASAGGDNGPLHALTSGVDGPNGVYAYTNFGGGLQFPNQSIADTNYWVDVVFESGSSARRGPRLP